MYDINNLLKLPMSKVNLIQSFYYNSLLELCYHISYIVQ